MSTRQVFSKFLKGSVLERVLLERQLRWKLSTSVVLLTAAITLFVYVGTGLPWPRPWYLFIVMAALTSTLPLHAAWIGDGHQISTWFSMTGLFMISWILRWTPLARPMNTFGDHEGFLRSMIAIAETGSIPAGGVYEFTPFIFELPQLWRFVTGSSLYETPVPTSIISAFLPIAIFLFLREAKDAKTGWFGAVLSVPLGLFLRSSVLVETPSIALTWLMFCFYLLARVDDRFEKRLVVLLITFVLVSTWIHPYYSLVTAILISGVLLFRILERRLTGNSRRSLPLAGVLAAAILVIFRSQTVWGLAVDGALSFSPGSLLQDPIATLYPTGGAIGQSLGQTSGSGATDERLGPLPLSVVNLYQLALLGSAAVIGGLYSLYAKERFLAYSGFLTAGFPFLLLLRDTKHAKFRAYYIIGVAMVIFAALLMRYFWRKRNRIAPFLRNALVLVAVILIFSYMFLGPVSAVGNDMDPRIGGTSSTLLPSDHEQLSALGESMQEANVVSIRAEFEKRTVLDGKRRLFSVPDTEGGIELLVTRECSTKTTLWDSGRFCASTV